MGVAEAGRGNGAHGGRATPPPIATALSVATEPAVVVALPRTAEEASVVGLASLAPESPGSAATSAAVPATPATGATALARELSGSGGSEICASGVAVGVATIGDDDRRGRDRRRLSCPAAPSARCRHRG